MPAPAPESHAGGEAPLRRLNRTEYDNTVRDLLGDGTGPALAFPADTVVDGFDNRAEVLLASPLLVEAYMTAAEKLAGAAVERLDALVPCAPGSDASSEEPCARRFITGFGQRAFRRPLVEAEVESLLATYRSGRLEGSFSVGVQRTVERVLQSPQFLYRTEPGSAAGPGRGVQQIDGWGMASRLSYFLWKTMPDERLFQLAARGALATAEQVADEATRMLDDPRAHEMVLDFHRQWLDLRRLDTVQKSSTLYPEFTPAMVRSMRDGTDRFVEEVIWNGAGDLRSLLTAPYSFADARLAPLYGVSVPEGGGSVRVDLPATDRAGLLTQASLLTGLSKADSTSPVLRGRFVRERLLCGHLDPPPPSVRIVLPEPAPGVTTRQRYLAHVTDDYCAGCHTQMDPIGFGFERYDPVGRIRTDDAGGAIDASGEIHGANDVAQFDGAVALAHLLAEREDVARCVVTEWFRYAVGRADSEADAPSLDQAEERFAAAGHGIQALIIAITQTDAFRYRTVPSPGAP